MGFFSVKKKFASVRSEKKHYRQKMSQQFFFLHKNKLLMQNTSFSYTRKWVI